MLGGRLGLLLNYVLGAAGWKPEIETTFKKLDALVQATAKSIANAPTLPYAAGDVYIVGSAPTGLFATATANQLAYFDITNSTWIFITPVEGFCVFLQSAGQLYTFVGGAWALDPAVVTANTALSTANSASSTATAALNAVTNNFVSKTVTTDQTLASNLLAGTKSIQWGAPNFANTRIDGVFDTFAAIPNKTGVYLVRNPNITLGVADSPAPSYNSNGTCWIAIVTADMIDSSNNQTVSYKTTIAYHTAYDGMWKNFAQPGLWKRLDLEVVMNGWAFGTPAYVTKEPGGVMTQVFVATEGLSIPFPVPFTSQIMNIQVTAMGMPYQAAAVTLAYPVSLTNFAAASGAANGTLLYVTAVGI